MSKFLEQKGGYRQLRVYRVSEMIYDMTYHFAHTHLQWGDRTIDQMVQAARSGKQNIAEGECRLYDLVRDGDSFDECR